MFEDIIEYMKQSKEDRSRHIDLTIACIQIGGASQEFRGLLSHFLKTTIPSTLKGARLCHACNNSGCSNVLHLYWGTTSENIKDYLNAIEVHPLKGRRRSDKHRKNISLARLGKKLSPYHKKRVSEGVSIKMLDLNHRKKLSEAAKARCARESSIILSGKGPDL